MGKDTCSLKKHILRHRKHVHGMDGGKPACGGGTRAAQTCAVQGHACAHSEPLKVEVTAESVFPFLQSSETQRTFVS